MTFAYQRMRSADVGVARIFDTYGPRMRSDDGRMVPTIFRQALAGTVEWFRGQLQESIPSSVALQGN